MPRRTPIWSAPWQAENVIVFEQRTIPCLTKDGKLLLASKSKLVSPHSRSPHVADDDGLRRPVLLMATADFTRRSEMPI